MGGLNGISMDGWVVRSLLIHLIPVHARKSVFAGAVNFSKSLTQRGQLLDVSGQDI